MKLTLRRTIIWTISLVMLVVFALLVFGKQYASGYLERELITTAQGFGLRLALKNTDAGLSRISIESGEVFIPKAFLLIPFTKVEVTPKWSLLFNRNLGAVLSAVIAKGQLLFDLSQTSQSDFKLEASGSDIDISELSYLSQLGFQAGKVNIEARHLVANKTQLTSGTVVLIAKNLTKPNTTKLAFSLGGFPLSLEIPPLEKGEIDTRIEFSRDQILIDKVESFSSWGTLNAKGVLNLNSNGRISTLEINGQVHLTATAHAVISSFLPLISQGTLDANAASFEFKVSGSVSNPKARFLAL